MTAKPASSNLPRWATGPTGIANTVEPSSGAKDDAWATGMRPPAGWLNWLARKTYDFLAYLDKPDDISLGADLLSSAGDAILARLKIAARAGVSSSTERTLIWESTGQGYFKVRLYRTCIDTGGTSLASEDTEWAFNCFWTGSAWDCEDNSLAAYVHTMTAQETRVLYHAATASTWTDGSWTEITGWQHLSTSSQLQMTDGSVEFQGAGSITNPSATTSVGNKAIAKNQCKLWALLETDGAGNVTIHDGFNITSATVTGGNDIEVTVGTDFAGTDNFVVNATNSGFNNTLWSASRTSAGVFQLRAFTADTGAQVNLSNTVAEVHVVAFGKQT